MHLVSEIQTVSLRDLLDIDAKQEKVVWALKNEEMGIHHGFYWLGAE
jgi:hypothetical protein